MFHPIPPLPSTILQSMSLPCAVEQPEQTGGQKKIELWLFVITQNQEKLHSQSFVILKMAHSCASS